MVNSGKFVYMVSYPLPPNTLVDTPRGYDYFNANSPADALQYIINHPEKYYLPGTTSSTVLLFEHIGMHVICEYDFNTQTARWRTAFAPSQGRNHT